MTLYRRQITYLLISSPLDFFLRFYFRFPNSSIAQFAPSIRHSNPSRLSSSHAHVIAIHPSRGCPSVVVVPFKATLQPLACATSALRCYTRPLHPQISFTLITFATLYMCHTQLCMYAIKFNYICRSRRTNFTVFIHNNSVAIRHKGFLVNARYLTL